MAPTRRILVTGAAGYIGRFVCQELAGQGFLPIIFDDFSRGRTAAQIDGIVEDGLMKAESLRSVIARHQPAAVIHLAGGRGDRHRTLRPGLSEERNLDGTRILLAAMADHNVQQIIFASSSAVYGDAGPAHVAEDAPLRGASAYGKAKIAAEGLVRNWGEDPNRGWIILRYANAAGADPESLLGWYENDKTIVPSAIAVAAGEKNALNLYGVALPTPDGTAMRDLVHCWDIAAATVRILRQCLACGMKEIFNVASSKGVSVAEIVAAAELVTQRRIPLVRHEARQHEIAKLVLSAESLARFGFSPRHSDLATIMSSAWAWYRKTANGPYRRSKSQPTGIVV